MNWSADTAAQDAPAPPQNPAPASGFAQRHYLSAATLSLSEIEFLLELADGYIEFNRRTEKKASLLRGLTQLHAFFEPSTRTQASFEMAGKRLGADVVNFSVSASSFAKGETLRDMAINIDAMNPDVLIVRHQAAGVAHFLARNVECAVVNAGDGGHEHPSQSLLDALALKRTFGDLQGLVVAICGDIEHSRVARSNVLMLSKLGAEVRLIGPPTLLPAFADRLTPFVFHDMRAGLEGCDVVMMLRLQRERMEGASAPSVREYFTLYGLDSEKLKYAKPGAKVMHPGPMNRGVEIASDVADDPERSLIFDQVEYGVAARMAILEALLKRSPLAS